jgi:hypothetical protein
MRQQLSRQLYAGEPGEAWNAFIDFVITTSYKKLTDLQRIPHLAMTYEAEVMNGGHLQYFENQGIAHIDEAIAALDTIEAVCQREVLQQAVLLRKRHSVLQTRVASLRHFSRLALEGHYDELDSRFYACQPSISDLLERFLDQHFDEFIELV